MLKNVRRIGLPIALGTALSLAVPLASFARDRDDERREAIEHERHEFREHHRPRVRFFFGPSYSYRDPYYDPYYSGPAFSNGYYDRWGYWHPYPSGFYDRWGVWHPYY